MSGQEWIPEPGDLRGDDRPLSVAAGPLPGIAPPDYRSQTTEPDPDEEGDVPEARPRRVGFRFSLPRFRARRDNAPESEEGVVEIVPAPEGFDPGDDADDDDAPAPRRRFGFRFALPRRARVEAVPDPDEGDEAEEEPAPPRRFPALALKREARVGIAAALSFLVLVMVWVGNKGRSPGLHLNNPDAHDAAPAEPETAEAKKDKPKDVEVADVPKPAPTRPAPKSSPDDPASRFANGAASPKATSGGVGAIARAEPPGESPLPSAAPVALDPATPPAATEPPEPTPILAADPDLDPIGPGSADSILPTGSPSLLAGGPGVDLPASELPGTSPEPVKEAATEPTIGDMAPPSLAAGPPSLAPLTEPPVADVSPPDLLATTPATAAPATEPVQPPPLVATTPEPEADPVLPQPEFVAMPVEPQPVAPVPTPRTPPFEPARAPVDTFANEPAATTSPDATDSEDGWVVIKAGTKRAVVSTPLREPAGPSMAAEAPAISAAPAVADGPAPREDAEARDQVEPKLHRVRSGENFWTISRLYYSTGRYYVALWAANAKEVPDIRELYVGTVLRIPPPEALDRSLVEPAGRDRVADKDKADKADVSRTSNAADPDDAADLIVPSSPTIRRRREVEAPDQPPSRPNYKVRAFETLRSIARDTLGDSRRDREILQLNRLTLRSASDLAPGQTLTLPADAVIGRKGR